MVKIFDLSKLLKVSFEDYCESAGKKRGDYNLVGFYHTFESPITENNWMAYDNIREIIPEGAEVVVGYDCAFWNNGGLNSSAFQYVSETALIPKSKDDEKS